MPSAVAIARRAAIAAALALGVAVGWWWLRAPAVERPAIAASSEPAIETPAGRARIDAALALATMPDDPWTFAETLSPAPASAPATRSRCGVDQRPRPIEVAATAGEDAQETDDAKPPATTAGPAYAAELLRVRAALRASSDPFDAAAADWLDIGDPRASADPLEALVQRAMTSSDPRVYALAFRSCHEPDGQRRRVAATGCLLLDARRWSELDPGNGVPWLYVFSQSVSAGDATAQQEALVRMAAASRFDERLHAVPGAIASHAPTDESGLAADLDLVDEAFRRAVADNESFNALMDACKDKAGGDANRAQECAAIGTRMFEHGDSLLMQAMGSVIVLRATGDATLRDRGRAEREVMSRTWSPGTGLSDCGLVRDGLKAALRRSQIGEVEAARERVRQGVAP
jgi:hypothetical protein